MAERRMFAKTIIDSDDFLDMPLSTQALYFHLSMRADDDGFINNPKKIQRSIGATDGDAAMLVAKKFIIPFASGVVVIKHWRINNYLRSDRYRETVYQDEKKALTIKGNGAYSLEGRPDGLPLVYQTETQNSIGKDRLVKDNISSSTNVPEDILLPSPAEKPAEKVPYQQILDLYYQMCPTMSQTRPLKKYTDEIKSNVKARWNEYKNLDDFRTVFQKAEASDFLNNRTDVTFQATFDWLMRKRNFSKALNGNFDNLKKKQSSGRNPVSNEVFENTQGGEEVW